MDAIFLGRFSKYALNNRDMSTIRAGAMLFRGFPKLDEPGKLIVSVSHNSDIYDGKGPFLGLLNSSILNTSKKGDIKNLTNRYLSSEITVRPPLLGWDEMKTLACDLGLAVGAHSAAMLMSIDYECVDITSIDYKHLKNRLGYRVGQRDTKPFSSFNTDLFISGIYPEKEDAPSKSTGSAFDLMDVHFVLGGSSLYQNVCIFEQKEGGEVQYTQSFADAIYDLGSKFLPSLLSYNSFPGTINLDFGSQSFTLMSNIIYMDSWDHGIFASLSVLSPRIYYSEGIKTLLGDILLTTRSIPYCAYSVDGIVGGEEVSSPEHISVSNALSSPENILSIKLQEHAQTHVGIDSTLSQSFQTMDMLGASQTASPLAFTLHLYSKPEVLEK